MAYLYFCLGAKNGDPMGYFFQSWMNIHSLSPFSIDNFKNFDREIQLGIKEKKSNDEIIISKLNPELIGKFMKLYPD